MSSSVTVFRLLRSVWAVALIFAGSAGTAGGQEARPSAAPGLAELPERFFQVQDDLGFLWQALDNGALLSGDTQYFQSGLNLIVNGEPFAPSSAAASEPGSGGERISVRLDETRPGLSISRDLWFDTRRSAVRVWDSFTNTGTAEISLEVVLRTTYPFAWQSLHGTGGGVLGTDPVLAARPEDISLGVHFSPSDGRHDTFFLFGSEKGGQRPGLKASANSRELIFGYTVTVPAGQSRSLVHWVLQRNLPEVSQDLAALAPFVQRGQWIDAGLDPKAHAQVANLSAEAFPSATAPPARLRSLVALNELTDRLGLSRRGEDLLWLGPSNAIAGSLDREGTVTVESSLRGATETPVAAIAAIRGGAGQGMPTAVYLRDGRVLTGQVTKGALNWTTKESPNSEALDLSTLHLVLCATSPEDGVAPEKTTHFLQIANGSVLAIAPGGAASLDWVAPWGRETAPWASILELAREQGASPKVRILTKDGSSSTAVLPPGPLSVPTADGRNIEVPAALVERIWTPDAPLRLGFPKGDWIDFSEVPEGIGPASGVLLAGNHLVAGTLAPASILLRSCAATVRVQTERIERLDRSGDPDEAGRFHLVLGGGERLSGEILDPYLVLDRPGGPLELPLVQILAYRKAPTP